MRSLFLILMIGFCFQSFAQSDATIREYNKTFTTYPFSDPNPDPDPASIFYPYFRYGSLITIENLGKMAMPVVAKITEQNGQVHEIKLPVEVWQRGGEWTFKCNSTSSLISIVLDPHTELPDIDRSNNTWKAEN